MVSPIQTPLDVRRRAAGGWGPFGVALIAGLSGAMGAYALQYEAPRAAGSGAIPVVHANSSSAPVAPAGGASAWLRMPGSDEPVLTLADLLELKSSLINAPDASGEFTRLAEQLLFVDATQRFQQLRTQGGQGGDVHELQQVAEMVDESLDTRLRRGEIALADAHTLKQQLLQVRQPDATVRQAEFVRWAAANATPP